MPVMAEDLERGLLAGAGELDALIRRVRDELQRRELAHHLADGRRADVQPLRQFLRRDAAVVGVRLVDGLDVVFDGGRRQNERS